VYGKMTDVYNIDCDMQVVKEIAHFCQKYADNARFHIISQKIMFTALLYT